MLTRFSESGGGIGIPYPATERPGGTNNGYVDLRRFPEAIHNIPELHGYPELFCFVQEANAPFSVFRTAGCATHIESVNGEWVYRGFIHLVFEILHWNWTPNGYRTLYADFEASLEDHPAAIEEAEIYFCVGPTSFWDHQLDGWTLRLFVDARGATETAARSRWAAALRLVSTFLAEFSAAHQPQLIGCLKRVS